MVNVPDALGDDSCTVTGIRAIDESGEGLVEMEITVGFSGASLGRDRPGDHPWFGLFRHQVRVGWNQGQMVVDPEGRIGFDVPRAEIGAFIPGLRPKYYRFSRGCDEPGDGGEQAFVVFGFADGGGGAVEAELMA